MKHVRLAIIVLFFGLFLPPHPTEGQGSRFRRLTVDNGLARNHVLGVHQAGAGAPGYIWLETEEGLSRFDGVDFHHFDWAEIPPVFNLDSLPHLFTTRDGRLYGSFSGLPYHFALPCPTHRSQNVVRVDGQVFIQHTNTLGDTELLFFHDGECRRFQLREGARGLYFNSLPLGAPPTSPSEGKSLPFQISTYSPKGVVVNIPRKGLYTLYWGGGLLSLRHLAEAPISSTPALQASSAEANIWMVDGDSLRYWRTGGEGAFPLGRACRGSEMLRHNGQAVFLSNGRELVAYDLRAHQLLDIAADLRLDAGINDLLTDREGNIWVATDGDGVYCVFPSSFTGYGMGVLGKVPIHHVLHTESLGLLAATDEGLYIISEGWSLFPLREGRQLKVYFMGENKRGEVLVSTDEGVFKITDGQVETCLPNERNLRSFLVDDDGYLSFFREGFLYAYGTCGMPPKIWPQPDAEAGRRLYQDQGQSVWMATDDGVLVYTKGEFEPKRISVVEGLAHARTHDFAEDRSGGMWVATDGGLSRIRPDGGIDNYSNLPSLKCRRLLPDGEGRMWVAGPDGVFLFRYGEEGQPVEKLSMARHRINSLALGQDHQLWVGTEEGLLRFDTRLPSSLEPPPTLLWRGVELDGKAFPPNEIRHLAYKGRLEISYAALAYRDAHLINYQYQLKEGEPWRNSSNRSLALSNLQAGKYEFRLRARRPNSAWSETLRLSFRSRPPWWLSPWFFGGLLLAGAGITAYALYAIRVRERRRAALKRRFAELELKALQAQMNPHFLFNTLNAIQHSILKKDTATANESLNSFASLMRLFLESSRANHIPLADELEMLRHYCELTRMCYDDKFDFNIKVDAGIDEEDVEIPTMLIQPFVENAIRHGLLPKEEKGDLTVDFSAENEKIICIIRDNGIGREKSAEMQRQSGRLRESAGMGLSSERANILNEAYHSDISIDISDLKSEKGDALGTEVRIGFAY